MQQLILIKHSLPEIIPSLPPDAWQLSEEGRRRCLPLANSLKTYQPGIMYCSQEPKAVQTAQITAAQLSIPVLEWEDLHEHRRRTAQFEGQDAFEARVARFFAEPDRFVFGEETAAAAHDRFSAALEKLLAQDRQNTPAVTAHGTVITLFVSRRNPVEPFAFWKELGLPSFVVLSLPTFQIISINRGIDTGSPTSAR
jgi:broad specificity phosphatase PhoE